MSNIREQMRKGLTRQQSEAKRGFNTQYPDATGPRPAHVTMKRQGIAAFRHIAKKHGYEKGDEVDTKEFGRGEIWYPKSGTQNGHVFIFDQRAVHQAKGMHEPLFNNPETHLSTPEALDHHLSKVAPKTEAKEPMPALRKRAKDASKEAIRLGTPEAHLTAAALHKECGDRMCDTLSARGQSYSATMGSHGDAEYWHKEQAEKLGGKK